MTGTQQPDSHRNWKPAGLPGRREELDGLREWLGLERFDRAGPDWSIAAAVALPGAALGGVVIGERRQFEAALAE